jgi:hypothetical protein
MTTLQRQALLLVAFIVAAANLAAQPAKSGFVIKKGNDTVAVELYSRDASSLTSEIYQSNGLRTQYTATLGSDATITYVEMSRQGRQGQGITVTVAFGDTLVTGTMTGSGGESERVAIPSRARKTPFLAVSFALCEQIVKANRLDVGKTVKLTAFRLGAADTAALTLTRFHADSVLFAMPDVQLKIAVSAAGDVTGGRHMGQDWLIERRK